MSKQFWIFYWNLERQRIRLSRTLPESLTRVGSSIPSAAQIVPVRTKDHTTESDLLVGMSLRSLVKQGRYLVINFGSCT